MKGLRHGVALGAVAAVALWASEGLAQSHPGFDCNLYGPTEPCDPYLLYPPGQDLRLTVRFRDSVGERRRQARINTLRDLFAEIRACWSPPPDADAHPGMELSVRFSFKRDGNIFGAPRFTYVSRAAPAVKREAYRRAVLESLTACSPFPITAGLGGAIAGRPLVVRYIDDRDKQQKRS